MMVRTLYPALFLLSLDHLLINFPVCQGTHDGYIFERGSAYYKFVPSLIDNRTFTEAREICREDEDGDLLTVENRQEMIWINQKIKNMQYRIKNIGKFWMGAIDKRMSLVYEYIDNTPFRDQYVSWLPGEPNRNSKLEFHHCLFLTIDPAGGNMGLGDEDCFMAFGYVCKGSGRPRRLRGEKKFGYEFNTNMHKYKFILLPWDRLTWFEARIYCEETETGHLLSVGSLEENFFVSRLMSHVRRGVGYNKLWIGASDIQRTGKFYWSKPENFIYSNWYDNKTVVTDRRSGDCAAINTAPRLGLWTMENCLLRLPFVCKTRLCSGVTDVAFVIDQSDMILEDGFEFIKGFVWQTIRLFPFANGKTRAALITFANKPTMVFDFQTHRTPEEIHEGIKGAIYTGGAAMVHKALNLARVGIFSRAGTSRPGAAKILVLITAGWENQVPRDESIMRDERFSLVRANVHRVVVGVGRRVDKKRLQRFATSSRDVIIARSFENLKRKVPALRNLLCRKSMEDQTLGIKRMQ